MAPSDQDLLDLTINTNCFKNLDLAERNKVKKAIAGQPASTPRSNIAKVAFYLARRLHPVAPSDPGPTPPPPAQPWDSGYAPQSYNRGSSGQDARFNIRINCEQLANGDYRDKRGVVYTDGGLDRGGRTGSYVAGLKPADEMDGREPWEAYENFGTIVGPNKENYPPASYSQ
jgi:hypothetical protein